ncbi:hypothetical protein CARUB_v10018820mg, partial [Capsella rubella]
TTKIEVFWDVEDFKISDGQEPRDVSWNITSALERQGYCRSHVSVRAFGEKDNKLKDEFLLAKIVFLPAGELSTPQHLGKKSLTTSLTALIIMS